MIWLMPVTSYVVQDAYTSPIYTCQIYSMYVQSVAMAITYEIDVVVGCILASIFISVTCMPIQIEDSVTYLHGVTALYKHEIWI